jgi:hypothetical protein
MFRIIGSMEPVRHWSLLNSAALLMTSGFVIGMTLQKIGRMFKKLMDERLNNYDWEEVFGEGTGGNCIAINPQPQPPNYSGSLATFRRDDVEEITQMEDGENDVKDWIIYGRLKDGRWFSARGGCDYTGWDCRATNSGDVADTKDDIIRFGLTDDERKRFGINL